MRTRLRRLNDRFFAFAERAQRVIGSPVHLGFFLVTVALWLLWSSLRHWDTFSALVMNDYSTIAEYAFEILILAAGLASIARGDAILDHLRGQNDEVLSEERGIEERLTALEEKIDRLLSQQPHA